MVTADISQLASNEYYAKGPTAAHGHTAGLHEAHLAGQAQYTTCYHLPETLAAEEHLYDPLVKQLPISVSQL